MTCCPPCGLPTVSALRNSLASPLHAGMADCSARFVAANAEAYARYGRRWVTDPLGNWSRQWEYPFVCGHVDAQLGTGGVASRILDAGTGFTFFPWFMATRHPAAEVHCCDYDPELAGLFQAANDAAGGARVLYKAADIRSLPFEDGFFDAVSCISVLEHTENYAAIVREFHRVLKPGGRLIVTFDVSVDGSRDIRPEEATKLVGVLQEEFQEEQLLRAGMAELLRDPDLFTTRKAKELGLGVLPWPYPAFLYRLQSLLKGKGWVAWPPEVAVCCLSLVKPG